MPEIRHPQYLPILLICLLSCTHVHPKLADNAGVHPVHLISSIKESNGDVKIDGSVISDNKNLLAFVNDIRESTMVLSNNLEGIPPFIKSFLERAGGGRFSIANPGKAWNCCDGNWDDSLPNRELICYGMDKTLFLISYKTGGIGETGHVILMRYLNNKVTDFWTGTSLLDLNSKKAILKYLTLPGNKHGWQYI